MGPNLGSTHPQNSSVRRILIAEDHVSFRRTVHELLAEDPGVQIVGEASSGPEAFILAKRLRPDLVILDCHLPGWSGIETARRLGELEIECMMLSLSYGKAYVIKALRAGVRAYLAKEDAASCLVPAIQAVFRQECFLSPAVNAEFAGAPGISAESLADAGQQYAQHCASLFHLARNTGATAEAAREALQESLTTYLILCAGMGGSHAGFIPWMAISVISILFGTPRQMGQPEVHRERAFHSRWWRRAFSHPPQGVLFNYWRGALGERDGTNLIDHLRGCRACHMDWSLAALRFPRQGQAAFPSRSILEIPAAVVTELRNQADGKLLVHLVDHEARMRALAAAEMDVFFGPSRLPFLEEFLGGRAHLHSQLAS